MSLSARKEAHLGGGACHDQHVADQEQRSRGGGEPIRVAVVDDQELFRRGLTMLLGVEDDIEVVGEAGDGVAATELAATTVPTSS